MPIRDDEQFCKYFLGKTEEEAHENYSKFYNTIKHLANNYSTFGVDSDDLFQEGLIGLARAVKSFDEERSRGEKAFKIFAIYHIKNAMREFVTKQAITLKTPQYLRDGIRLMVTLKELLRQAGENVELLDIFEIWELAKNRKVETRLDEKIQNVVEKFRSLADRSSSPVYNLLNRIEPLPLQTSEIEFNDIEFIDYEDYIIDTIDLNNKIQWLMGVLTEEEFNLLWQRYVNHMSLRILAEEMGVSAVSVGNTLKRLKKKINQLARREMI